MPSAFAPSFCVVASLISVMLLSGTACTVIAKAQYSMWSVGIDGSLEQFRRPLFGVFTMNIGMSLVGVLDTCLRRARGCFRPRDGLVGPTACDEANVAGADGIGIPRAGGFRQMLLIGAPAACDLAATAASSFGLLFVPASIFQMLRGSSILFAAMLSMALLGKRMRSFEWLGLGICTVGVVLVGFANMLNIRVPGVPGAQQDSLEHAILGMGLVLIGQALQAAQIILEEYLLQEVHLPPLTIVGVQGYWGLAIMCFVQFAMWFLPGQDNGHLDDFREAFVMVANSPALAALTAGDVFAVSCVNTSGIGVTAVLSGVHRVILDAIRTAMVWAVGLFVHYCVDEVSGFGEVWTRHSRWELLGLVALIFGQLVYAGALRRRSFLAERTAEEGTEQKAELPTEAMAAVEAPEMTPEMVSV